MRLGCDEALEGGALGVGKAGQVHRGQISQSLAVLQQVWILSIKVKIIVSECFSVLITVGALILVVRL